MPNVLQGENVKITLNTADAFTAAVPVVLVDSNGNVRTLQSYEQLVIDMLNMDVDGAAQRAGLLDPGAAFETGTGLLGTFSTFEGNMEVAKEGLAVSKGSTPVCTTQAVGAVLVTGAGRITVGKSQGVQAGYKASLTPGNQTWQ